MRKPFQPPHLVLILQVHADPAVLMRHVHHLRRAMYSALYCSAQVLGTGCAAQGWAAQMWVRRTRAGRTQVGAPLRGGDVGGRGLCCSRRWIRAEPGRGRRCAAASMKPASHRTAAWLRGRPPLQSMIYERLEQSGGHTHLCKHDGAVAARPRNLRPIWGPAQAQQGPGLQVGLQDGLGGSVRTNLANEVLWSRLPCTLIDQILEARPTESNSGPAGTQPQVRLQSEWGGSGGVCGENLGRLCV